MKKGFTLIELLSVVAILALLVIIALPNVMGMFNQAKKNSFETETKTIYKAAKQEWMNDSMFGTGVKEYGKCEDCSYEELDLSGRSEIEYYIKIDKGGRVVKYKVTDGTHQFSYEGNNLLVEDIKDVEVIAEIEDETQIIAITNEESEPDLGKKITVCIYSQASNESTHIIKTTTTCYSKQTVRECLGSGFYSPYLYNSEETHPDNNIITCYATNSSTTCSGNPSGYMNCMNNNCSNTNLKKTVSVNDIVLPKSYGCYSHGIIALTCLDGETLIEVYDKKKKKRLKKKLKDITYDDLILCWDFDKGEFVWARPLWIMKPQEATKSITLTFDDGNVLKVIGNHRIYSVELNKFVCVNDDKESPIGMHTFNSNGDKVKLISKEVEEEDTLAYNVITERHINMFANNILTSQGSNNIYDIEDMKFVKADRDKFTSEELKSIDKEYIEGLRLEEWITDFKGSREESLKDMYDYVESLVEKKM